MKNLALALLCAIALATPTFAQSGAIAPTLYPVFLNTDGKTPVANGFLCTTASGTDDAQFTYQDDGISTPNQDPVRLNAAGRAVNGSSLVPLYLNPATPIYRFTLYAAGTSNSCNGTPVGAQIMQQDGMFDLAQFLLVGNNTWTGTNTFTGATYVKDLNNVLKCDQFSGANAGAKIAACIAAIPSTGGTADARGFQGAQAINQDVFSGVTKPVTLLLGAATFTLGASQSPATDGVAIIGLDSHDTALSYGGSGYAISAGSQTVNVAGFRISDLSILLTGDSSNAIQGELLHEWVVRDVYVQGNHSGSQTSVCLSIDGRTVDSIFGRVDNLTCNHVKTGFLPLSTGSVNKTTTILFTGFYDFNDAISGSKCFDFGTSGTGDGFISVGGNCESSDYGLYSDGGGGHDAHLAKWFGYRFEAITTNTVFFGAFTQGLSVIGAYGIDSGSGVSDSTTFCNTYFDNRNGSGSPADNSLCGALPINQANAPTITTGGFTGAGVNPPASTQPYFGLAASGAGGVNFELGANGATDVHELIQSGGAGTTFTVRSIAPGSGIVTFPQATSFSSNIAMAGGLTAGSPSGGNLGSGTINVASGVYLNNTLYTNPDYVFEKYFTGKIVKFAANKGASAYKAPLPLSKLSVYLKANSALPGVHLSDGEIFGRTDMLLEKLEEAYIYILQLNDRLAVLEKKK